MTIQISEHAAERIVQRGLRRRSVELAVAYADVEMKRRSGAVQLRMSRSAAAEAEADGHDRKLIEGARNVAAIYRDGLVITQYRSAHCRDWRARRGTRARR